MARKKLRPYQEKLHSDILAAWRTDRNVMAVLPTGGGKTVIFSEVIHNHRGAACVVAHRQELVAQISLTLCGNGVSHRIIAPTRTVRDICRLHYEEVGESLYDPNSRIAVAGVDTLIRRTDDLSGWADGVTLWVMDEAHHVLRDNKWGRAVNMFPRAKGLGVTATPLRADGNGLGLHADGYFQSLVLGPDMRQLIDAGYLTDYRIFAPPSDLDLGAVSVSSSTGDYTQPGLRSAIQKSHIVGDVVSHYRRIADGRLGITFAVDVETATDIADQFKAAGVAAEVLSAKTPDRERSQVLRRFARRELTQIVNVDLFGEGFDLPALEVVSMARPTQSYGLYAQQFGRALRPMDGKGRAVIIDHVGNVTRHGLPDAPRVWSLDARERRAGASEPSQIKACPECTAVYERYLVACPYCGFIPVPTGRTAPEFVDGDLAELDADTLAQLRRAVERVDMPLDRYDLMMQSRTLPTAARYRNVRLHRQRQEAQSVLRDSIAWWAGYLRQRGHSDREIHKRFYLGYGVDILSAQALGVRDAEDLTLKINTDIGRMQ